MKKIVCAALFAVSVLSLIANLSGCKTTEVNMKEHMPVAIASVYCNPSVPWYSSDPSSPDDPGTGAVTNMINKALNSNNPELITLNSRIDGAAETLCHVLEENGIEVLDAEKLAESKSYQKASIAWLEVLSTDVPASGYKALDYNGKSRNRRIAQECGAESLIFAEFVFEKQKIPVGLFDMSAAARVTLKIYVCDSMGKKLLFKTYSAISPETTEYNNGSWDRQAVCDAFPSAIESVVNQFVMDYALFDSVSPSESDGSVDDGETDGDKSSSGASVQSTSISLPRPAKSSDVNEAESESKSSDVDSEKSGDAESDGE